MKFHKMIKTKQKLLDGINCFKKLQFYNTYIEKPKIKRFKNIDLLSELPLYKKISVVKTNKAFRDYEMTYKVEMIDKKILYHKDLFNDILGETKIIKLLSKCF